MCTLLRGKVFMRIDVMVFMFALLNVEAVSRGAAMPLPLVLPR